MVNFGDYDKLQIGIKTWQNTYVSADNKGSNPGVNQQSHLQDWEKWYVMKQPDGTFGFLGAQGLYMSSMPNGGIDQQGHCQDWEKWSATEVSPNVYSFQNPTHKTWLSANNNGNMDQANHEQAWEQFTVSVQSPCTQIYEMTYQPDKKQVLNTAPTSITSEILTNNTSVVQTMNITLSSSVANTSSWSQTSGITVTTTAEASVSVPDVGGAKFSVSTAVSQSWTNGGSTTDTSSFSATFPVVVPAGKSVQGTIDYTNTTMSIPWTGKASWTGYNNVTVTTVVGGIWTGTNYNRTGTTLVETPAKK